MYYLTNSEIINHITTLKDFRLTASALVTKVNMNSAKLNVYTKVFQEVC